MWQCHRRRIARLACGEERAQLGLDLMPELLLSGYKSQAATERERETRRQTERHREKPFYRSLESTFTLDSKSPVEL